MRQQQQAEYMRRQREDFDLQQKQQQGIRNSPNNAPNNAPPAVQYSYKDYMKAGYEAEKAKDYDSALMYFNDALTLKPGDVYATRAINKVTPLEQAEIQKSKAEAQREEQKREVELKRENERIEDDLLRSSCTSDKETLGLSEKRFYSTYPDCAKYFPGNYDVSQPNSSPAEIMQRVSQMSSREIYEAYVNHVVMKNLQESLCPIFDPHENEPHGCTWNVKDSVEVEFNRSRQKSGSSAPFNPNFDVKNYDPFAQ